VTVLKGSTFINRAAGALLRVKSTRLHFVKRLLVICNRGRDRCEVLVTMGRPTQDRSEGSGDAQPLTMTGLVIVLMMKQ
jgi:hypothetical protein